jgi:hypothetical protein
MSQTTLTNITTVRISDLTYIRNVYELSLFNILLHIQFNIRITTKSCLKKLFYSLFFLQSLWSDHRVFFHHWQYHFFPNIWNRDTFYTDKLVSKGVGTIYFILINKLLKYEKQKVKSMQRNFFCILKVLQTMPFSSSSTIAYSSQCQLYVMFSKINFYVQYYNACWIYRKSSKKLF